MSFLSCHIDTKQSPSPWEGRTRSVRGGFSEPRPGRVFRVASGEGFPDVFRVISSFPFFPPLRAYGSTLPEGECRFCLVTLTQSSHPPSGRVGRVASGEGFPSRVRGGFSGRVSGNFQFSVLPPLRAYGSTLPEGECRFCLVTLTQSSHPPSGRVGRVASGEGFPSRSRGRFSGRVSGNSSFPFFPPLRAYGSTLPEGECRFCLVTLTQNSHPPSGRVGRVASGEGFPGRCRGRFSGRVSGKSGFPFFPPLRAYGSTLPEGECRFYLVTLTQNSHPPSGRVGRVASGEGFPGRSRGRFSGRVSGNSSFPFFPPLRAYGSTLPEGECRFYLVTLIQSSHPPSGGSSRNLVASFGQQS